MGAWVAMVAATVLFAASNSLTKLALVLAGLLGVTAYFALENLGVQLATAVNALNLVPVWGVVIAATVLGERVSGWHLLGGAVVFAGVLIATRVPAMRPASPPPKPCTKEIAP